MNDLLRKTIVAAPLAACVLMMVWYWLGGVDGPEREPDPAAAFSYSSIDKTNTTSAQRSSQRDDARAFSSWTSYQGEIDGRTSAHEGTAVTTAPAPVPMDIPMPEQLYTLDSQVPVEQRIEDVSQRAVRGENPQVRAAALGELAVIGDTSALNTLNEALVDTNLQVRLAAVAAAQRLAQFHGDENGEIQNWLVQAANDADAQVAVRAREGANELAQNRGEEPPFHSE